MKLKLYLILLGLVFYSTTQVSANPRVNSDIISGKLSRPDFWDFYRYMTVDQQSSLKIKSINSVLKKMEKEKNPDGKFDSVSKLIKYGNLLQDQFIYKYHRKLNKFESVFGKWESKGRKGKRPVYKIGDDSDILNSAMTSYRHCVFDFPKKAQTDELLFNLSRLLVLTANDNAIIYANRLKKKFPKSKYIEQSKLIKAEYYFSDERYKLAHKIYKKLARSSDQRVSLYSKYKLAWIVKLTQAKKSSKISNKFKEVIRASLNSGSKKSAKLLANYAMKDLAKYWATPKLIHLAKDFFPRIHQDEFYIQAQERIARKYIKSRNIDGAVKIYRMIVKLHPVRANNPQTFKKIVDILDAQKKYPAVIKNLNDMIKSYLERSPWRLKNKKSEKTARLLMQDILYKFANKYFEIAKKTNNPSLMEGATKIYEVYIKHFPKHKKTLLIRLKLAKYQSKQGMHMKASQNFATLAQLMKKNPSRYYFMSKNSLVELTKATEQMQFSTPKGEHPLKRSYPIPRAMSNLIKKIDEHLKMFSKTNFDVSQKLYSGTIYLTYGHYDKSVKIWTDIIKNHSKSKFAQEAIISKASYYILSKKWKENSEFIYSLFGKDQVVVLAEKTRAQLIDFLYETSMELGKQSENRKKFDEAALTYRGFQSRFPKVEGADEMLFKAFKIYEKQNNTKMLLRSGAQFIKNYKNSPLFAEVLVSMANLHANLMELEKAAKIKLLLASKFPKHKLTPESILSSGNYFEILGQRESAVQQYFKLFSQFPTNPMTGQALIKGIRINLELKDYEYALKLAKLYVNGSFSKKPAELNYANVVIGVLEKKNIDNLYGSVIKLKKSERTESAELLAKHFYTQLTQLTRAELNWEIPVGEDYKKIAAQKKAQYKQAQTIQKKILILGNKKYILKGNFEVGQLYGTLSKKFRARMKEEDKKNKVALENTSFEAKEIAERYFEQLRRELKRNISFEGVSIYRKMAAFEKDYKVPSELLLAPTYSNIGI